MDKQHKAITLWEPWASLMAMGVKTIETRHWSTHYRGDLIICSAKKDIGTKALAQLLETFPAEVSKQLIHHLTYGKALCKVRVVDCKLTQAVNDPAQLPYGNYEPNRFAWITEGVQVFKEPQPIFRYVKGELVSGGSQGFFNIILSEIEGFRKMIKKTQYVVGFLYNETRDSVCLIRKNKPEWQKGLLNGVGGKVEPGEAVYMAMIREFKEEAGVTHKYWELFCKLSFNDCEIFFYSGVGDLKQVTSKTEEKLELHHLTAISRLDVIENLKWLIPLGAHRTPGFIEVYQPYNC